MNRRTFLKRLGVGLIVAPVAAKAALQPKIQSLELTSPGSRTITLPPGFYQIQKSTEPPYSIGDLVFSDDKVFICISAPDRLMELR